MTRLEGFYIRHRDAVQLVGAAFIAGGVLSNLYVTKDGGQQIQDRLAQVSEQLAADRALTEYRMNEHDRRIVALEQAKVANN